jgi:hypothetical protein
VTLEDYLRSRGDRCPGCLAHVETMGCSCAGLAAKSHGQQVALAARPDDRARVESAIRQLAATGRPFSANDARALHGIRGGVVGATFTALKTEGVIKPCGDEISNDKGTHGHRIYRWIGAVAA